MNAESLSSVLDKWRDRLRPQPDERKALEAAIASITAAAHKEAKRLGDEGRPSFAPILVGSAAKDTWLHGHVDLDLFLMFDTSVPREELEALGLEIGQAILPEWRLRYAEHPYVHGTWAGYDADVVPAYAVDDPHEIQSAVDRTPFHNEWVMRALAGDAALTDEIRLCKAWLRGVGVYGAETAQGGVSGYLAEVLVIHHGGFVPFLEAARGAAPGWRLDPTGGSDAKFPDSVLVVIDPVDRERNAASAVIQDQFARLVRGAEAFLEAPGDRFFAPAPLVKITPDQATRLLGDQGLAFVTLPLPEMREDARVPHLRRGAQALGKQLERDGFEVVDTEAGEHLDETEDAEWAWLAVRTRPAVLPESREHVGPPPGVASRADSFRAKYADHPDALGAVEEREVDGKPRLVVLIRNATRTLDERIQLVLGRGVSFGKHVDRALATGPVEVVGLERACDDARLNPVVAELLCPLDPWDRTGEPDHDYRPGA